MEANLEAHRVARVCGDLADRDHGSHRPREHHGARKFLCRTPHHLGHHADVRRVSRTAVPDPGTHGRSAMNLLAAFRSVVTRPAVPIVAIATLALGLGVNAAIFSLTREMLLRPLPYR